MHYPIQYLRSLNEAQCAVSWNHRSELQIFVCFCLLSMNPNNAIIGKFLTLFHPFKQIIVFADEILKCFLWSSYSSNMKRHLCVLNTHSKRNPITDCCFLKTTHKRNEMRCFALLIDVYPEYNMNIQAVVNMNLLSFSFSLGIPIL